MKKGLILALSLVVLAFAGTSYGNAPFFTQDLPDVVIGDNEDQPTGLTIDTNFFRYQNALNILDYVSDSDTTADLFKLAFVEGTDTEDLSINDIVQLDSGSGELSTDDTTWGPKELANGLNFWFSFRDLIRSPVPVNPGDPDGTIDYPYPHPVDPSASDITTLMNELCPWHNTPGSPSVLTDDDRSRDIWIIVADESHESTSKSMVVYSMNYADDGVTGGFDEIYSWDTGTAGACITDTAGHLSVATTSGGGGSGLEFLEASSGGADPSGIGYYVRWQLDGGGDLAGPIPYVDTANIIYEARMDLELTAQPGDNRTNANHIRFGVADSLQQLNTINVLMGFDLSTVGVSGATGPEYNAHFPNVGETNTYTTYWANNEWIPNQSALDLTSGGTFGDLRSWIAFFDVLDYDDAHAGDAGTWRLTDLTVGTITRPPTVTVTPGSTIAFLLDDLSAGGTYNWRATDTHVRGSLEQHTTGDLAGAVTFHSAGTGAGETSKVFWRTDPFTRWTDGMMMRFVPRISCPASSDRATFQIARVSHITGLNWVNQEFMIRRNAAADSIGGNPGVPVARSGNDNVSTAYEGYLAYYGGPSAALVSALTTAAAESFLDFYVDVNHLTFDGSQSATNWTLHSIKYEILADPDDFI